MTTTRTSEPERWTDRSDGPGTVEDVLGDALRGARAVTTPSDAFCARIEAGLRWREPVVVRSRWRVAAVAAVALLAVGGSVGAARGPLRAWATRHAFLAPEPAKETPETKHAARAVEARVPEPQPEPIVAPPALMDALVAEAAPLPEMPRARPAVGPVAAPPTPESAVVESPAAEEARLLNAAFHALRAESRADAALAALDDYERRFPSGLLGREARLARVEALLALGERARALAVLDPLDADGAALPRAARVARGELRVEAGRCAEAAPDFAAALASSDEGDAGARALHGLASCALRTGDAPAAVAALTRYLEVHPSGAHAAEAREALARLSAGSRAP
jgi:hypothetical protein